MSSDSQKKHVGYSKYRSLVKVLFVILCCVGVMVALRFQDRMMGGGKVDESSETTTKQQDSVEAAADAEKLPQKQLRADASGMTAEVETKPADDTPVAAAETASDVTSSVDTTTTTTKADIDNDNKEEDLGTFEDKDDPAALPDLPFDDDRPILVLGLPFNGDLVVPRYFQCAGVNKVGRYWTNSDPNDAVRRPLGKCLQFNMEQIRNTSSTLGVSSIMEGCGRQSVWMELQYIQPPVSKGSKSALNGPQCFDPVLFPGALEQLYKSYPQAIVMTVQRKQWPELWLEQLPKDTKTQYKKWCNPTHDDAFPKSSKSSPAADAKYIQFYKNYYKQIETFIEQHDGWGHVSVNLDQDPAIVGQQLEEELKLPQKCWKEAVEGEMVDAAGVARRPMDISFPVLMTSLPKSGTATADKYFACGLGQWAAAHQWTTPSDSTPENPIKDVQIGTCFQQNFQVHKKKDVIKGCGHARVWADIGYLKSSSGQCYYPTLDDDFLEAFAKYYPKATIFHVVRDAGIWLSSARDNNLPKRWRVAQHCDGFPSETDDQTWEDFYNGYTTRIRKFAAAHSNMTYIEVPLGAEGGVHLEGIFGFHPKCWGSNLE